MAKAAVFVQTNESEANRVIAFARDASGRLAQPRAVETGGRGDGIPHLTSQGSVVLTYDGLRLLVTNAGSDDVSLLSADDLSLIALAPSGGRAPKSIAEHAGLVYVVNSGDGSLVGFRVAESGLSPLADSHRELGEGVDPAQASFSPDGRKLVVTDRGHDAILVYPVGDDGRLADPRSIPSSGPTPYGFTFVGDNTLVVTEAFGAAKGQAAASSYRLSGGGAEAVSRSVGNGRSEICWAVAVGDRFVFTTNFADGAVSRFVVEPHGGLTLADATAGIAVDGQPGLRDEGATLDGRFLYAIDADGGRVFGWAIADGGSLQPVGEWNGLPTTIAGLAAR
jgi:6-phosphogluconolactonase (cycloisomerase 2 family)